ncbi:MAG: ABC transporter permease [Acidobacteriota bacterium]
MSIIADSFLTARELLSAWTMRTLRARYQQSILGWFWAIVQPAASVAIYTLVFTRVVRVDTGGIPYPVFAYIAVVPWTFLASSLTDMNASLVTNITLVQKISFPREVLPLASMLARLMDFAVGFALLAMLMVTFETPFFPATLPYFPLILLIQVVLTVGIGLACAALNVLYRDIQSLLVLLLNLWFYASPIIYPVSLVPKSYRSLYFLNPMAAILQSYRDVLLAGSTPGPYLLYAGAISALILALGYGLFKRIEPSFADMI